MFPFFTDSYFTHQPSTVIDQNYLTCYTKFRTYQYKNILHVFFESANRFVKVLLTVTFYFWYKVGKKVFEKNIKQFFQFEVKSIILGKNHSLNRVLLNPPTTDQPTTNHLPTDQATHRPPIHRSKLHRLTDKILFQRLDN